jgi:hypothetical protein
VVAIEIVKTEIENFIILGLILLDNYMLDKKEEQYHSTTKPTLVTSCGYVGISL